MAKGPLADQFQPFCKVQSARRYERTEFAQAVPCHKSRVKCCAHALGEDRPSAGKSRVGSPLFA